MFVHSTSCRNGTDPHLMSLNCLPVDMLRYLCHKLGDQELLALMRVARLFHSIIQPDQHLYTSLRARHIIRNLHSGDCEKDIIRVPVGASLFQIQEEMIACVKGARKPVILLDLITGKNLHTFTLKAPALSMQMDSEHLYLMQTDGVFSQCSLKDFKVIERSHTKASAMILLRDYLLVEEEDNSYRVFSRGQLEEKQSVKIIGKILKTTANDSNYLLSLIADKTNKIVAQNIATGINIEYPLQETLVHVAIRSQVLFLMLFIDDPRTPWWLRTVDISKNPYAVVDFPKMNLGYYVMILFHQYVLFVQIDTQQKIPIIAHLSTQRLIHAVSNINLSTNFYFSDGKISLPQKDNKGITISTCDYGYDLKGRPANSSLSLIHRVMVYGDTISAAAQSIGAIGIMACVYYLNHVEQRKCSKMFQKSFCELPSTKRIPLYGIYIICSLTFLYYSVLFIYRYKDAARLHAKKD